MNKYKSTSIKNVLVTAAAADIAVVIVVVDVVI